MTTILFIRTLAYFLRGKMSRKEKKKFYCIETRMAAGNILLLCYVWQQKNKLFVFYITKIEIAFGSGNFRLWECVSAKQTFLSF